MPSMSGGRTIRKTLAILREPIPRETRTLLNARWRQLPPELQTDSQIAGKHLVHCAYIMGPSYCSFRCTHCYLPSNANRVPLPSLAQMKTQVEANRRMIGPGGGLQITGGDVVDAYWRAGRADELVAIIRHATDVGVVPMLMTHGQVLLDHPEYLACLVRKGGLRKLALHVDITQAGRPGFPFTDIQRESDLHALRESFVDLIHRVRRTTGIRFFAAHTATVTERNLDSIGDIVRWLIADARRLDVFHTVSFQTEADVGRTRLTSSPVTPKAVWEQICSAVGTELPRDNLLLGHPDCSNLTTILVLFPEGRIINLIPSDARSRAFWSVILRVFGGVGGRGEDVSASVLRKLSAALHNPSVFWHTLRYAIGFLRREGGAADLLSHALRGKVGGLNVVLHNFMSHADMQRPRSEVVEKRLRACVFRGAVMHHGEWTAIPMCEMNGEYREPLYANRIAAASGRR